MQQHWAPFIFILKGFKHATTLGYVCAINANPIPVHQVKYGLNHI